MELNGLIAVTVTLGTIGHVLFLCQNKTQNFPSHFSVHRRDVESDLFKRYTVSQPRHQARHPNRKFSFRLNSMVRQKYSGKPVKSVAKRRKEEHKIKWNPNSAHKNETLQNWTEVDMQKAMDLYAEGKYSQREISRRTGIHVATLNKRFRGLVKGTGHQLGGKRAPKVLKHGMKQARHQVRHPRCLAYVSRLHCISCVLFILTG